MNGMPLCFELEVAPVEDECKDDNAQKILKIETLLGECQEQIDDNNDKIENLTANLDKIDIILAGSSGLLCGLIDSFFVGEFSLDKANEWGNEKVDCFVVKVAQNRGYEGNDLPGAVKFLEENFEIAADKAKDHFGGGLQHHLRDFSHHPTIVGLLFSVITQFTECVYGTDVSGMFSVYHLKDNEKEFIGNSFPSKITLGVINWFFHLVSDMAGSSSTVKKGNLGTGIPGPLGAFLKELSALPIFKNTNNKGYKKFSIWISKLFNGTLLGTHDENGKIIDARKFDLRTELGIQLEIGKQAIPVIINECIVRGFYFIRRLINEIKLNSIKKFKDLKRIDWAKVAPWKNRTIVRMLTISTSTFMVVDVADAAIRTAVKGEATTVPTFLAGMALRINYVGVGRVVIAYGTDLSMEFKRNRVKADNTKIVARQLELNNAKIYLYQAGTWISAENTEKVVIELQSQAENLIRQASADYNQLTTDLDSMTDSIDKLRECDPSFADELKGILGN